MSQIPADYMENQLPGAGEECKELLVSKVLFWGRVSGSLGWLQTCYVSQNNLELLILPFQPPRCWDYKPESQWLLPQMLR